MNDAGTERGCPQVYVRLYYMYINTSILRAAFDGWGV